MTPLKTPLRRHTRRVACRKMQLRLVVSGIDVALSQRRGLADVQPAFMHRCGAHAAPWSLVAGPLACGNQSAMTKKCICQFWTRCGISYSQWCGVKLPSPPSVMAPELASGDKMVSVSHGGGQALIGTTHHHGPCRRKHTAREGVTPQTIERHRRHGHCYAKLLILGWDVSVNSSRNRRPCASVH